jgi:hypothetical protein
MTREINVNDVWKRRVELHDAYDVVRVVGRIDNAGFAPDEWTIQPANAFGETIGTDAAGILDHCELVSSGDPEQAAWEAEL